MGAKMITKNEIKIIDQYVVKYDIPYMDLHMFRVIVSNAFPSWRSEQLTNDQTMNGNYFSDTNGLIAYTDYINNTAKKVNYFES